MNLSFNGVGFNYPHLAKFTEEKFIAEFKDIHWQDTPEPERLKLLKEAYAAIKKADADAKKAAK